MLRIVTTLLVALVLLGCAAAAFWYQDLQYALPTPRPSGLVQISNGEQPDVADFLPDGDQRTGYRLLHFFNPGCPCSRFNLDHIRYLIRRYGAQVQFVAVLQVEEGDGATALEEFRELELDMEVVIDTTGGIADQCGVYSTPQAVVLDRNFRLYYRGNYNISRYCSQASTEFVRIALDSLLAGAPVPVFNPEATVAYGCELPANLAQE